MDARSTHTSKLAVSLAAALLFALPAFAQPVLVANPAGPIQIGSQAGCNNLQLVNLTSSPAGSATGGNGAAMTVQASIAYDDSTHGNWVFVTAPVGSGTVTTIGPTTATAISGISVPAAGGAVGQAGTNIQIGLNLANFVSGTTDFATVNLLVTSAGGPVINPVPIRVQYSSTAACNGALSNGSVSVTPNSLPSLTAAQGSSTTAPVTVTNLTSAPVTFSASTPVSDSWLSTDATTTETIPANGTATVNVTATASSTMNVATYSSTITFVPSVGSNLSLPVNFIVTAGTSATGTLTLNGATSNVANVSFTYIANGSTATGIPPAQTVGIQDSNASVTTYGDNFTTASGGAWLSVNGTTITPQFNQALGSGVVTIQPTSVVTSLNTGVYTGTVNLVAADGSTATVNVTLYVSSGAATGVTVSPGVVYNFPSVAAGSTTAQTQQFTVTAASGVALGAATQQSGSSVFTMTTQSAPANTDVFTVSANPTGLGAGTYTSQITIPSTGSSSGTTTILITLTVGQGSGTCTVNCGGTVTSVVVPSSLAFADSVGNNYWTGGGAFQALTITGASGTDWSAVINYASGGPTGWLLFGLGGGGGTFGNGPATLSVSMAPNLLAASTTPYTATIAITTVSGTINVPVTLLVTPAGTPVLLGSPASTRFVYSGGAAPAPQTFNIGGTDLPFPPIAGSVPVATIATTASWLTASQAGNVVTLTANPTGLGNGAYWTTVAVTAAGYANSPFQYPVTLVVGNGIGNTNGPLTISTSALNFTAPYANQTLTVTAASPTTASVSVGVQTCTSTPNWLSISPTGGFSAGTTGTVFTVSVTPSGIATGTTCNGTITFTSGASTQTVGVTMTVGNSVSGNVTVTPAGPLNFAFTQGQANPAAQTVQVVNTASGTAQTPFTVVTSQTWITTNWVSGTSTPFGLAISVNPASLAASATPYTGTVTITPTGGTAVVVTVNLTVSANPVVTATPTTLSFSYIAGGNTPASQTVNVSAGGATAPFTVQVSSSGWLHVSPLSGTTPNAGSFPLTVTVDPTGQNAGPALNGTITVSGTSPATGTTIIAVSFTVTAPLPTITKVVNAASGIAGAVSPGELITLFANAANPIGPATSVQLNSTTCPSPCTQVPIQMGGVQVIFLPSGVAAPLLYVSAGQINAVVPYEVANVSNLQVEVKFLGQTSNAFVLQTATTAPGIFTQNSQGSGLAAANVYDLQGNFLGENSSAVAAGTGYVIALYATGEGATSPPGVTGKVINSTVVPVAVPTTCFVGTQPATVQFSGESYGLVSGVWQVNVYVPAGAGTGPVGISCALGGGPSTQIGVTVFLK
jgi:uncharacterized protein (TIGR03437 family)